MNKETVEALEASIVHWDENAKAIYHGDVSITSISCSLCHIFNRDEMSIRDSCNGCPVLIKTGKKFCERSPYDSAVKALKRWESANKITLLTSEISFRAAAIAERDFLISLREPIDDARAARGTLP